MTKPRLQEEGGITVVSLQNDDLLTGRSGHPVRVEISCHPGAPERYHTMAMYADGTFHVFTGFGWGYGGEGPRGLAEFCRRHRIPLTMEEIGGFDNIAGGPVWAWPCAGEAGRSHGDSC